MVISEKQFKKINANLLYKTIGIELILALEGKAVSKLKPEENICWPFPGQPHGGILFTQMDTTMAWAVLSTVADGKNCATINLEIQYPAPARGNIFTCETRVIHNTGRSCFLQGETKDDKGGLVAMGQATFRVINVAPMADF